MGLMHKRRTSAHAQNDPGNTVRIDLHVHGQWSPDAIGDLDQLADKGEEKGLAGLALTEHNTARHHDAIRKWNKQHKQRPFTFYPGIEISTQAGHLLAIGVQQDIKKGQGLEETIDQIQDAGGLPIPSHPYRRFTGIGDGILQIVAGRLHVIEAHNAQETARSNKKAQHFAASTHLGASGGSDAHQIHDVANGYTIFERPVDSLDDLLTQLKNGKTRGAGGRTRLPTRMRQRARIAVRWSTRRYR